MLREGGDGVDIGLLIFLGIYHFSFQSITTKMVSIFSLTVLLSFYFATPAKIILQIFLYLAGYFMNN